MKNYHRYNQRFVQENPCTDCGGKVVAFGEYDDHVLGRSRMLHCQRCGRSTPQKVPDYEKKK